VGPQKGCQSIWQPFLFSGMEQYFVYILFSQKLDKYYVGFTNNVSHRITQHNSKHKGYTSTANDWVLMFSESFATKHEAEHREKQIKGWKSRMMIEKLITSVG
jgi:putative endonuclease